MKVTVNDDNFEELKKLLIGKKIVGITRDLSPKEQWTEGDNSVQIILEDKTTIDFCGYGYDHSGLEMEIETKE